MGKAIASPGTRRRRTAAGVLGGSLLAVVPLAGRGQEAPEPRLRLATVLMPWESPGEAPADATAASTPPLLLAQASFPQFPRPAPAGPAPALPGYPPPQVPTGTLPIPVPPGTLPIPAPSGTPPTPGSGYRPPGPEGPVPFDRIQAPPPRRDLPLAPERVPQELPDLSGEEWHLAPIRWGGSVAAALNNFKDDGGTSTSTRSQTLNLRSSSHIYQPWFAQVNGQLGLMSANTERTLPGNLTAPGGDTRSNSLSYGGALNLFPLSWFPFQAFIDHSDSRASSNVLGTQFTSTRLGLRQAYRPLVGSENYAFSYDRSALTADAGRSVVDALQGNYSLSLAEHSLTASGRYSQNTGGINGEASRLWSASGSHIWRVEEGLSVTSTANFSDQQIRYLSSGLLSSNDSRLMQASSLVTWTPDEDLPLTVIGGGNLLSTATRTNTGSAELTSLGGFAGLTYRFTNRFTGTGNLQLVQTQTGSARHLLAAASGGLSYSGEPLKLGNFLYHWNTGTNASIQSITGGASLQSLSVLGGHGLNRSFSFGPGSVLSLTLGQSAMLVGNSQTGDSTTLSHSAGASWRLGYGERLTGLFATTVADNITTGRYAGHYRSFSLNGSGLGQISRRASVNASANLYWSQQKQPDQQQLQLGSQVYNTGESQWSGSAALGYNHFSPFGIPLLYYSANLIYASSQVNRRIVNGDPNALNWQVSRSFQQRLSYRVGRLNFQLLGTLATVNGKKNASLFFQVSRDFGDL